MVDGSSLLAMVTDRNIEGLRNHARVPKLSSNDTTRILHTAVSHGDHELIQVVWELVGYPPGHDHRFEVRTIMHSKNKSVQ